MGGDPGGERWGDEGLVGGGAVGRGAQYVAQGECVRDVAGGEVGAGGLGQVTDGVLGGQACPDGAGAASAGERGGQVDGHAPGGRRVAVVVAVVERDAPLERRRGERVHECGYVLGLESVGVGGAAPEPPATTDLAPEPEPPAPEQITSDEPRPSEEPQRPDPLQAERDHLLDELRRARTTIHALEKTTTRQRTELRKALERADRLARDANAGLDALAVLDADSRRFADPDDQLRFEVNLAWARRTTAEEKSDLPLAEWTLSDDFLDTLTAVEGIDRAKVVDVVVDVLTGRAWQIDARQVHQLRTNEAGNASTVVRDDGATCWRANLQTKTASARRLHWWQLPSGAIELSAVRLHDDVRP